MLIIRREQVEAFRRAAAQRFERDLAADLRRNYPAPSSRIDDEGMIRLIRDAEKRGASYGITTERDIATLAELDFNFGAPFERQKSCEWAVPLLADQSLTPGSRLALIMDRLPEL